MMTKDAVIKFRKTIPSDLRAKLKPGSGSSGRRRRRAAGRARTVNQNCQTKGEIALLLSIRARRELLGARARLSRLLVT